MFTSITDPGYFWIRIKGTTEPQPAYWSGTAFYLCATSIPVRPEEIDASIRMQDPPNFFTYIPTNSL